MEAAHLDVIWPFTSQLHGDQDGVARPISCRLTLDAHVKLVEAFSTVFDLSSVGVDRPGRDELLLLDDDGYARVHGYRIFAAAAEQAAVPGLHSALEAKRRESVPFWFDKHSGGELVVYA